MSATEAHRAALAAEYGQFRAIQQIHVDGVLAYNVGAAVPASNVEKHGYLDEGLVERVDNAPAPAVVDITKGQKRSGTEG